MLTFNAELHEYHFAGKRVPSVTQVLAPLYDFRFVNADALEVARQEGMAIHKTVELYVKNDLDEDDLPEWLQPRLAAFKKFQAETQFEFEASEQQVHADDYGYAGTLDLKGAIQLPKRKTKTRAIFDIKRSFSAGKVIGLQLAGYQHAEGSKTEGRFALQLRADSTYRLERFDDPTDFSTFLACLTLHKWKERHGHH